MAKKKDAPKKALNEVTFKYIVPEGYTPLYANGTYGGINVKGEIEMHFVYDRRPFPKTTTHAVEGIFVPGVPLRKSGEEKVTLRCIQTGVVMSIDTAKSLRSWLDEKIKFIESQQDETG
jgi:hypothetical protein